ncbi:DNA-binding, RecF [Syntrophomonas zehnderi OL-4]|uniref:DNA replication and repair protein RecF n=1 Tax=Syntrophomonas zehnderi OL-4 TaxID=690567 RepID=A0A0E3W2V8_9FIRM|nr:DNA replication/repair protein RecF [Syntrophomonas zehnderi]CFX24885.1 DNA-binding, RecF [Syntrophomonas zehnderi OL-4]
MVIKNLKINNFRNLKKVDLQPANGLNIVTGENAQGKTNLLEAIYVLSAGNSFRSGKDLQMINYGATRYQIKASYSCQSRDFIAALVFDGQTKNLLINQKKVQFSYPDSLKVVLFNPDDLFLIKGSPNKRRSFIDFILQQLSAEYSYDLVNYSKILKKRNLILKTEQTNKQGFTIINQLFIENAVKVIIKRINLVNIIDELAAPLFLEINGGRHEFRTKYAISFPVEDDKINQNILYKSLSEQMEKKLSEEIKRKQSLIGPQLDDINFYLDGKPAKVFASQGQQRNMVICLKLAEVYAFKKVKGYYPVFLLDEVLAELDENKRLLLLKHLEQAQFQSFLSAVNIDAQDDLKAAVFHIKNGQIKGEEKI